MFSTMVENLENNVWFFGTSHMFYDPKIEKDVSHIYTFLEEIERVIKEKGVKTVALETPLREDSLSILDHILGHLLIHRNPALEIIALDSKESLDIVHELLGEVYEKMTPAIEKICREYQCAMAIDERLKNLFFEHKTGVINHKEYEERKEIRFSELREEFRKTISKEDYDFIMKLDEETGDIPAIADRDRLWDIPDDCLVIAGSNHSTVFERRR